MIRLTRLLVNVIVLVGFFVPTNLTLQVDVVTIDAICQSMVKPPADPNWSFLGPHHYHLMIGATTDIIFLTGVWGWYNGNWSTATENANGKTLQVLGLLCLLPRKRHR